MFNPRPLLDYQEQRPRVRWWWHLVYSHVYFQNWLFLAFVLLALVVAAFFALVAVFGFAG